MCGRFAITLPPEAMVELFQAVPDNDLPPTPNYNVCPTMRIHAVTREDGIRRLRGLRWGFIPHWYKTPDDGPLLINARAESVAKKPAFARAARERRCLIPASGFYEWEKAADGRRLPWYITARDDSPLAFAGIWQRWEAEGQEPMTTTAIITTNANPDIAHIHSRAPVIIAREDWPLWLGEAGKGAALLMRPAPPGSLKAWRVSTRVNSSRAQGPELIEPVSEEA
ncbi:MAG: SOS response-associated peptidase [Alphaproteobacteria bacterium]|nr:MAG: SOS response-associated peptidase [Alphaproteobacteria bacterium]